MNCSPNFTEWTREEKEEFAKKRMAEMTLKNEKLLRRHAEVEHDRITAESQNSAVTNATKVVKKEKSGDTQEFSKVEGKTEHAREWDRGKPDKDNWKSPEHHGSSFKSYRTSGRFERKNSEKRDNWRGYSRNDDNYYSRNRITEGRFEKKEVVDEGIWSHLPNKDPWKDQTSEGRFEKKEVLDEGIWAHLPNKESWKDQTSDGHHDRKNDRRDTWSGFSRNQSTDHYRHDRESTQNRKVKGNYRYKQPENDQHHTSRRHMSPKRTRGMGYRSNDSHRKSQHSYSDDKYKKSEYNRSNSRKKYSYRAHSRSSSRSELEVDLGLLEMSITPMSSMKAYNLWQNEKIKEDRTKKNRVEKWVKSVNKSNMWGQKQYSPDQNEKNTDKSYSKFDRFERTSDKSSEEGAYPTTINASGGTKSRESSNYTSLQRHDYNDSKNQNRGTSHNVGMTTGKHNDILKKGFKTKRSPQYGSSKNENFRKQRRFDSKGHKYEDDKNKFKSKMHDNDLSVCETWKRSEVENNPGVEKGSSCNRSSKFDNTDTWNQEDDGIWGSTEQSDIKWKLSDDEADLKGRKNQNQKYNVKKNVNISDGWNDNEISTDVQKNVDISDAWNDNDISTDINKNKEQVEQKIDDDGIWTDYNQTEYNRKNLVSSNTKMDDTIQCVVHSELSGVNKSNTNEISEGRDERLKITRQITSSNNADDVNIPKSGSNLNIETTKHQQNVETTTLQQNSDVLSLKSYCEDNSATNSAEKLISSFKHSVCISDEKITNLSIGHFSEKNPVGSDDGGWSTVSEEGEIHSDDMDRNEK